MSARDDQLVITQTVLEQLKTHKNLLAFSGGIDSTALFFLLKENGVDFDCAIVNYHTRKESDQEEEYARKLCQTHSKQLYVKSANAITHNFEAVARKIRYDFFDEIIGENGYTALITAHQLNDWTEWFLMQLCKGAGFFELCGTKQIDKRDHYTLFRQLLNIDKNRLIGYLKQQDIHAFTDQTNSDQRFLRNHFRARFANELIDQYSAGIERTFTALQNDRGRLENSAAVTSNKQLFMISIESADYDHQIDIAVKKLGVLLTRNERLQIIDKKNIVVGRKIAVAHNNRFYFVAPYRREIMPKDFREKCRKMRIPPQIRGYIFIAGIEPQWCEILSNQNPI